MTVRGPHDHSYPAARVHHAARARAQQAGKLPTLGFFAPGTQSFYGPWFGALAQRLRELGWIEGRNIAIVYRWAEGHAERYDEIAAELVQLRVDVIVTSSTPTVIAAKHATSVIPIVFASVGDPLGSGLVASLARPGGNVTGLSLQQTDTAAKRLGLLRECVPALHRLAILINSDNPADRLDMREVQTAASALGLDLVISDLRRSEDIFLAFAALKGHVDALYVVPDPLTNSHRVRIITLAQDARLPTMWYFREHVEAGGLMSYGANNPHLFRRAADYVDKILRGAKPADLPVEQPTKFDFVINLTTAKVLGLTVPQSLLATADEVIE
jgi:putative tryptophan/tyrosine transport system substrate-binding protein